MVANNMIPDIAHVYLKTVVSVEYKGELMTATNFLSIIREPVHVITAWNPGTERPTYDENLTADEKLRQALIGLNLEPFRALGTDPDSDHIEESWAVSGLSDREARKLGAEFGQVAIFRLLAESQTVFGCLGNWSLSRSL